MFGYTNGCDSKPMLPNRTEPVVKGIIASFKINHNTIFTNCFLNLEITLSKITFKSGFAYLAVREIFIYSKPPQLCRSKWSCRAAAVFVLGLEAPFYSSATAQSLLR